ncbi:RWD domain-containing protein 3-like [Tachypleus tridentatus]|uniref:RWD domain-containing protein 3-like n=1 Tax=Tachypleus tridentatus TaxID=6853 RepID=UPI003FD61873
MVMDLVLWLQENGLCYVSEEKDVTLSQESEETWTTLLSLDHMRSKTKYVKTLKYWAGELRFVKCNYLLQKVDFLTTTGNRNLLRNVGPLLAYSINRQCEGKSRPDPNMEWMKL